jgi:hypothetical protein
MTTSNPPHQKSLVGGRFVDSREQTKVVLFCLHNALKSDESSQKIKMAGNGEGLLRMGRQVNEQHAL